MRTVYDKVLCIPGISATETILSLREVFRRPLAVEFIDDVPSKKR
jgi:hypothetical protein